MKDAIDFPPNGDSGFKQLRTYNVRNMLTLTLKENITSDDSGVVFSVYGPPRKDINTRDPLNVNVFASTAQDQLLIAGQEYLETMFDHQRMMYLKLSKQFTNSNEGFTIVEISNCLGNQSVQFLTNPEQSRTSVEALIGFDKNGRQYAQFKNPIPRESFYVVVQPSALSGEHL